MTSGRVRNEHLYTSVNLSLVEHVYSVTRDGQMKDHAITKLQLIQNNAARLVMGKKKSDHFTTLLMHLHRLSVKLRIIDKIIQIFDTNSRKKRCVRLTTG